MYAFELISSFLHRRGITPPPPPHPPPTRPPHLCILNKSSCKWLTNCYCLFNRISCALNSSLFLFPLFHPPPHTHTHTYSLPTPPPPAVPHPQKQLSYNTSKAGVVKLTQTLGTEWIDRGVRVNCISP